MQTVQYHTVDLGGEIAGTQNGTYSPLPAPEITEAGSYTYWIKAVSKDENHADSTPVEYTATITKRAQSNLKIESHQQSWWFFSLKLQTNSAQPLTGWALFVVVGLFCSLYHLPIILSPDLHGRDDGPHGIAKFAQRILHPGRHLGIDRAD